MKANTCVSCSCPVSSIRQCLGHFPHIFVQLMNSIGLHLHFFHCPILCFMNFISLLSNYLFTAYYACIKNYISKTEKIFDYFFLKGFWDLAPWMLYLSYGDAFAHQYFDLGQRVQDAFPETSTISCFDIFKLICRLKDTYEASRIQNPTKFYSFLIFN